MDVHGTGLRRTPQLSVGRHDNTHFNEFGARRMAELVINDMKQQHIALAEHIVTGTNKSNVNNAAK